MDAFPLPLSDTHPEKFSTDEVAAFAQRTGWIDDRARIMPGQTHVERRKLSWWRDRDLIIARDLSWQGRVAAWVLERNGRLVRLDGTSSPIHRINALESPVFTREAARAYLGFFCTFVHGSVEGQKMPFALIETIDDWIVPAGLSDEQRREVAVFLRNVQLLKEESAGEQGSINYHFEAVVYYGDAVFLSNFRVQHNGMVEMIEDEQLVSGLGVHGSLPLVFTDESVQAGIDAARSASPTRDDSQPT